MIFPTVQQWLNHTGDNTVLMPYPAGGDICVGLARFDEAQQMFYIYTSAQEHDLYHIAADQIQSGAGCFDALLQIHSKAWVTGQHLKDFLDCVTCWAHRRHGKLPQGFFGVAGGMSGQSHQSLAATERSNKKETPTPAGYMDRARELLTWLDLPGPLDESDEDPLIGFDEGLREMELALCFPNLSIDEREMIDAALAARRTMRLMAGTLNNPRGELTTESRAEIEQNLSDSRELFQFARHALENYGLRAKLTAFQEQLLDDFICEGDSSSN